VTDGKQSGDEGLLLRALPSQSLVISDAETCEAADVGNSF